jgi:hypothetical protein
MENGESVISQEQAINLAWNATDTHEQALTKLEYFLVSHHGHLTNLFKEIGETEATDTELYGFWLVGENILNELKETSKTLCDGIQSCRK